VRVGLSMSSIDNASRWIADEIGDRGVAEVSALARERWSDVLDRIRIETDDEEQRRYFYTSLARMHVQPRDRTGDLIGASGSRFLDDHYTLWDTFRSYWPLMMLIDGELVEGTLETLRYLFERDGEVGTAIVWGSNIPSNHQGGHEAENLIADAVRKGFGGDRRCELAAMAVEMADRRPSEYTSLGYMPTAGRVKSGSATIGLSFNDHNAASMATLVGDTLAAAWLGNRARSWRALWDPAAEQDGFDGFIRPRNSSGELHGDLLSWEGFYEANSWTYSFQVHHDIPGLIDRMGGSDRFVERVEHAIESDYLDFSNQPAFSIPWVSHYAGRPDVAMSAVDEFLDRFVDDRYAGQEDCGAMSSLYVLITLGLYPALDAPVYLLHGPRVGRAHLTLQNGRSLRITSDHPGGRYVQGASLDGEPLDRAWITFEELMAATHLAFRMGETPTDWGWGSPPPGLVPSQECGSSPVNTVPGLVVAPSPARVGSIVDLVVRDGGDAGSLLRVHDVSGREVASVVLPEIAAGVITIPIDVGRVGDGGLDPGVYFLDLDGRVRQRLVVVP